jgi:uncharacterized membrane protein
MATTTETNLSAAEGRGSRFTLWHAAIVIEIIALLVTGYLSYVKIANVSAICVESGPINCEEVQSSAWSVLLGIPIAYLGFAAHVAIFAVLLLQRRVGLFKAYGLLILLGITLFGLIYHVYLVYTSIAVIKAICPWCIAAAILMLIQFILTIVRLQREPSAFSA